MGDKKYYWLKLKKDFFKRHDIQIIEAMPNGKDYILFYLKLLVESVDHEGNLRFNDTIPYNENMLSTITNTNVDIVRSAMKVFTELKMIEVLGDETIYMSEVIKMVGAETYWAEQKRKQRQKEPLKIGQCPPNVQAMSNVSNQEIEKEIDIEIDKDIDIKKKKETKKTNYDLLIDDYTTNKELKDTIYNFIKMRKTIKAALTDYALKLMLKKLSKFTDDDVTKIEILEHSVMNSWKDIYKPKEDNNGNGVYGTKSNTGQAKKFNVKIPDGPQLTDEERRRAEEELL